MKMGDDCSGKMVESGKKKNMEGEYVYFHQITVFYQSKYFSSGVSHFKPGHGPDNTNTFYFFHF